MVCVDSTKGKDYDKQCSFFRGAGGVAVIIIGNERDNPRSNARNGCFTFCYYSCSGYKSFCFSPVMYN